MTSNQGDEDTLSQASFGSWERDFEDTGSQSDGSGWWSDGDGDDTSREGSDFSEDSATGQAFRPNHSGMEGRQGKGTSNSKEQEGTLETTRRNSKSMYSSDPLAYRLSILREKSVGGGEDEDESVLKSNNAANCADTDVFKMIVEMLLGSPSELFSEITEYVIEDGDVSSYLQCLETKPTLFRSTGLLDDVHFQYWGKESSSHFVTWFIDTASEVLLCRKFVNLSEHDLIALSSTGSSGKTMHKDGVGSAGGSEVALLNLINSIKSGVCKLVSNFESDVGRLEIEHNCLIRPKAEEGDSDGNAYFSAAASFHRQQVGAATFLGRESSFQLSKSLFSLHSACEMWKPVLRSCSELVKSLVVVVHKHRAAFPLPLSDTRTSLAQSSEAKSGHQAAVESLAEVSLAFTQNLDECMRASQIELIAPPDQDDVDGASGGAGSENLMQLRLRELRGSRSPSAWFAIALQRDLFPASMAYLKSACKAVQALGRKELSHFAGSSSSISQYDQDLGLIYPAEHTFSSPGAGLSNPRAGGGSVDFHAMYRPSQSGDEDQRRLSKALLWPEHEHGDPSSRWRLSGAYADEEHSDEPPVFRALRERQRTAWDMSVKDFERRVGGVAQENGNLTDKNTDKDIQNERQQREAHIRSESSRSTRSLPAMSLLQVTVLQSSLHDARQAELQRTAQLWSRLLLHRRFEALQAVYFLGDESVFQDMKRIVFSDLDVPAVHAALDMRTRVRRQLDSPHSSSTMRLHLAGAIEDRIKTLVGALLHGHSQWEAGRGSGALREDTEMFFSVSLDPEVSTEADARTVAGDVAGKDALAQLRLAARLSIQVRCIAPLSLVLSEPLCLCYESTLGFLMVLSTCRWVCESVRMASKAALISHQHRPGEAPPEALAAHSFKKDCHVTLGLLLHMLGAIRGTVQVQAHQATDYRQYQDEEGRVPWAVDELRGACEYMLREVVRVLAQLQPAVVSLTSSAALFAGKYRSLLQLDADIPGPHLEAFQLHSRHSAALQAQLLETKRAMRGFLRSLEAIVRGGGQQPGEGGQDSSPKCHACLVQLRDKLRTLISD